MNRKYLILGCFFMALISVGIGCSINNSSNNINVELSTEKQIVNYVGRNFNKYSERIKNETGYDGNIIEEQNDDNQKEEFIEFNIDDSTKIKLGVEGSFKIFRELQTINNVKEKGKIIISLFGLRQDDKIDIELKWDDGIGGALSCNYRANDIEHPLPDKKEKDECIDSQIKANISTEEIEELIAKAHSIYNVFEEIADEYNESIEENS